jgi:N-acetylmuramoyl-L-alanine amidase
MKHLKFLILILTFIYFINSVNERAMAIDLVFPQTLNYETWANTTYIMGSVKKGAELTINGEPVKVWDNGAFCHIIEQIPVGDNTYVLNEVYKDDDNNDISNKKTLKIKKHFSNIKSVYSQGNIVKRSYNKPQPPYTIFDAYKYGYVLTDGAPIRNYPSTAGDRISHLPIKTVVILEGEYKDWYKIRTQKEPLWIYKKNVKVLYSLDNDWLVSIRKADIFQDNEFEYLQLSFDVPVPYKIEEKKDCLDLTIWGVYDINAVLKEIKKKKSDIYVKSFENNILTISIPDENDLWGYDASYDNYTLIFKKRKNPVIVANSPLKGLKIAVDAGHGGKEKGTIGPTLIPEKDVNLAISQFVQAELEKKGANVVMTRSDDSYVEIYSRVQKALDEDAVISISIHSNSMQDGNPLERHGVSVFYYNDEAFKLADAIKSQMVNNLDLKDAGTNYSSLVLTRATMPISVLVEVGYMPNPDEYAKLINPKFQKQAAKAIVEGLEKYLKEQTKNQKTNFEENKRFYPVKLLPFVD